MNIDGLGEFGLIERIRAGEGTLPRGIMGIGDDCAVLPQRKGYKTLVSTDLLMEGVHFLLEVVGELLGHFRIVTGELLVAVFGVNVFCDRDRRLLGVEDKRSLSFSGESRIVAEQSPVTGIHD